MSVAHFVNIKRTWRGDSSRPGGIGGEGVSYNTTARGQAANKRRILGVIGPRQNNVSKNDTNKESIFKIMTKTDIIFGKETNNDKNCFFK